MNRENFDNYKIMATNAIYLEDNNGQKGRSFKSRFLQAGLVKYDFGVCLLKKETIDKFVNTFVECPVIIEHKDNLTEADRVGTIQKIWFSADDGWFWCSGIITDEKAIKLIEDGYNVSCQYRITNYVENIEGKLHNANPYDKEILDGVFEHLAIVENPRYEDAFIAVNAYIDKDKEFIKWFKSTLYGAIAKEIVVRNSREFLESEHPRDRIGRFTRKGSGQKTVKKENSNWFPTSSYINNQITNIAGVKKGKPMSHKQAMNVNPNYYKGEEYRKNCVNCVIAYNLRKMGYNVQAKGANEKNPYIRNIMEHPEECFLDLKTKKFSDIIIKSNITNRYDCYNWLNKIVNKNELYLFSYHRKGSNYMHAVVMRKNKLGLLCLADPQKNIERCGKKELMRLFNDLNYSTPIKILRTDNKIFNWGYFKHTVSQHN